jgi:hypothetical protein
MHPLFEPNIYLESDAFVGQREINAVKDPQFLIIFVVCKVHGASQLDQYVFQQGHWPIVVHALALHYLADAHIAVLYRKFTTLFMHLWKIK